jgi:hypothetical protein
MLIGEYDPPLVQSAVSANQSPEELTVEAVVLHLAVAGVFNG